MALIGIPVIDQYLCFFCGPSPENSVTAKAVPHVMEDDCLLKDGFEKPGASPKSQPNHIHFCILHSTVVVATEAVDLAIEITERDLPLAIHFLDPVYPEGLFHPPYSFE